VSVAGGRAISAAHLDSHVGIPAARNVQLEPAAHSILAHALELLGADGVLSGRANSAKISPCKKFPLREGRKSMEAAMNLAGRLFAVLTLLLPVHAASAGDESQQVVNVGIGIICDSAEQVERYIALKGERAAPEDALRKVNDEANNPAACGVAAIAFVADEPIRTVSGSNGAMRIVRITVIATATENGWHPIQAITQYTAVADKSEEA
jgi:hypothetical protein